MSMKKLVLIGAIALVVVGCVIAAGCTSNTTGQQTTVKDNALTPVVGQWICTNFASSEGKTVTAVQTIKADGTGYWMELDDNDQGFKLSRIFKSTFSKPDQKGEFEKASSSGKNFKMVYDAAKGTITQDGKNVYTKIDPIVGIWSGKSALENGKVVTNSFKNDGTGVTVTVFEDGSIAQFKMTWTKNTDGTYAIVFPEGTKQTYTVASDGKTLKTDDGRTKTKQFLDDSFLMSVTGPWYNKDNGRVAVFNGDGTGAYIVEKRIFPFTWKLTDIGKFAVTYTEGSDIAGKTYDWTYDRLANSFTDGTSVTFVRPTESIEGKITLS